MDRRDFLKKSALGCGAVALGTDALAQPRADFSVSTLRIEANDFVKEPARKIPVLANTDVVVVGGGPAGVAAALSAARAGSSVWLIERYNHLGGLWTGGLVLILNDTYGMNKQREWVQTVFGVSDEITHRLDEMGMLVKHYNPTPDPEACKYVMAEMLHEAGVNVIYGSVAANVVKSGNHIDAVLLETKSGRVAIKAKMVVDCTGDGDVIEWVGEKYAEIKYLVGLNYRLGNVDRVNTQAEGYQPQRLGMHTPIKSVNWVNVRGGEDVDALNVLETSRVQYEWRKSAWEKTQELRQQPGYEEVFLLDTASQLGVRLSRVLDSLHIVTLEESMTFAEFPDVVGIGGGYTNIPYNGGVVKAKERPCWQIPLRALLPRRCENLIIGGRCFGFEEGLAEDAREIGNCLLTGQAAGAAAASAIEQRTIPRELDVPRLQRLLRQQKVNLG